METTDPVEANTKRASWIGIFWILLADGIGTSVLSFDKVAAEMGWLPMIASMVGACCIAMYTARLMACTHFLLRSHDIHVTSMGEAAGHTFCSDSAARIVLCVVYGYALLDNSTYLLVLGQSLQGTMVGIDGISLNLDEYVLISAAFCMPFVCLVRNVRETVGLACGNMVLLVVVLIIVLSYYSSCGRAQDVQTFWIATDLGIQSFAGAATNILYAFSGHWLYFELIAAMERPEDFQKAYFMNVPVQLLLYLCTACFAYYYVGTRAGSAGLVQGMPRSPAYHVAQGLLFLHVVVVFLVKTVVLVRFCVLSVSPGSEDAPTFRARAVHAACAFALVSFSCTLSITVPFYDYLRGAIGGLFAAPVSYIFPPLFFAAALGRFEQRSVSITSGLTPQHTGDLALREGAPLRSKHRSLVSLAGSNESHRSLRSPFGPPRTGRYDSGEVFKWRKLRGQVGLRQLVVLVFVVCLGSAVACIGTIWELRRIVHEIGEGASK